MQTTCLCLLCPDCTLNETDRQKRRLEKSLEQTIKLYYIEGYTDIQYTACNNTVIYCLYQLLNIYWNIISSSYSLVLLDPPPEGKVRLLLPCSSEWGWPLSYPWGSVKHRPAEGCYLRCIDSIWSAEGGSSDTPYRRGWGTACWAPWTPRPRYAPPPLCSLCEE